MTLRLIVGSVFLFLALLYMVGAVLHAAYRGDEGMGIR